MRRLPLLTNKLIKHGMLRGTAYAGMALLYPGYRYLINQIGRGSYSFAKEDLIALKLLENPSTGTYVDIGAFDPIQMSNTALMHRLGWHGWNIDANPSAIEEFNRRRAGAVNICCGVAQSSGQAKLYVSADAEFSTMDPLQAQTMQNFGARIVETATVECLSLTDLVLRYRIPRDVDFCSIDVEGMEEEILRGNNWDNFRPRVFCIEIGQIDIRTPDRIEPISNLLSPYGYELRLLTYKFGDPLNAFFRLAN